MTRKVYLIFPNFYISFDVISLNVFHITFKRTTVTTFPVCIRMADIVEIIYQPLMLISELVLPEKLNIEIDKAYIIIYQRISDT